MKRTIRYGKIDIELVGKDLSDEALKQAHAKSVSCYGGDIFCEAREKGGISEGLFEKIVRDFLDDRPNEGPLYAADFVQRLTYIPCDWDWYGGTVPVVGTKYKVSDYGLVVYGLVDFINDLERVSVMSRDKKVNECWWETRPLTGDPIEQILF